MNGNEWRTNDECLQFHSIRWIVVSLTMIRCLEVSSFAISMWRISVSAKHFNGACHSTGNSDRICAGAQHDSSLGIWIWMRTLWASKNWSSNKLLFNWDWLYSRICGCTWIHRRLSIQFLPLEFLEEFTASGLNRITICYRWAVDHWWSVRNIPENNIRKCNYPLFRVKFVALTFGISGGGGRLVIAAICWFTLPAAWFCNWFCVGMTTLSVSESRRELFAVDVAVLGLSRPPPLPVLWSMIECEDDLCVWMADGSGDFDCTDAASWIAGRTWTNWKNAFRIHVSPCCPEIEKLTWLKSL